MDLHRTSGTAWKVFYETILAREGILAQMQELNSTPMSCDNVSCADSPSFASALYRF